MFRENTEKYVTFTFPIEKEVTRIDKNGEEITKTMYIIQITIYDSARFRTSSLSNLVDNLAEGIHKIKRKYRHDDEKCETCGIKYKDSDYFLDITNFKDDLTEYKCLWCNKNYQQNFDEKLKERFFNTYKFFKHDNNKFILLLHKGVYAYECMDDWEKFNETPLPEKADFYSHLNIENITDADYTHEKRVCKDFEIKIAGDYHDLHV